MKPLATIFFYKLIQDSQDFGSDNEHMVSRIFYQIDGKNYYSDVRQPYGSDHSFEEDPIEIEMPEELKYIIRYGDFREVAEDFFRTIIGSEGDGIRIVGGGNIRMQNNTFDYSGGPAVFIVERATLSGGGW